MGLASCMSACVGLSNEGLLVSFLCTQTSCPVVEQMCALDWAHTYKLILATPLLVLARCRSPGDLSQVVSYEFGTNQATRDPSVLSSTYIDLVQSLKLDPR